MINKLFLIFMLTGLFMSFSSQKPEDKVVCENSNVHNNYNKQEVAMPMDAGGNVFVSDKTESSKKKPSVGLYCASANQIKQCYFDDAKLLGKWIGTQRYNLVYGGSAEGLMECVADHVIENGGTITGVLPDWMNKAGLATKLPGEILIVDDLNQCKQKMLDLSDVIVALPGGFGTFDEIFSLIASARMGFHHKKLIICNTNHFYDNLFLLFNQLYNDNFATENCKNFYLIANSIEECISVLDQHLSEKE